MAFVNLAQQYKETKGQQRGGRRKSRPNGITVATYQHNKSGREYLHVKLGETVMQKMKWKAGQYATVLFDPQRRLCRITLDDKHGFCMSAIMGKEFNGNSVRSMFRIPMFEGMPHPKSAIEVDDWAVVEGSIEFSIPYATPIYSTQPQMIAAKKAIVNAENRQAARLF